MQKSLAENGLARLLRQGSAEMGVDLDSAQVAKLLDFLALLTRWNSVYNLTAIRDPQEMLVLHLLDSLSIVPTIDRLGASHVLDVGSGAGFPGIPLAIARPALMLDLVDTVQKKIAFLTHAKAELKLDNIKLHHARVETLKLSPKADCIVSRAFSNLSTLVEGAQASLAPGGRFVAMKGAVPYADIAALPKAWRIAELIDIVVPGLDARRSLVVIAANQ